MRRARKPKVPKLDEVSNAVVATNPLTESTNDGHDVGRIVGEPAKGKAEDNLVVTTRRSERKRGIVSSIPSGKVRAEKRDAEVTEKEEPRVEKLSSQPMSDEQSMQEQIKFLVESVKAFNSKGTKRPFVNEDQAVEHNYKTLYIESQKMVETLTKENQQLTHKLQAALGKIEAYENMKDAFGSVKDMVLVSNLTKATDALVNFSSRMASFMPAIAAQPYDSALQATNGQATTNAVAVEVLNASLPEAGNGQGITSAVAAEHTALPQETSDQATTAVTAEPAFLPLKRSKRSRKKTER